MLLRPSHSLDIPVAHAPNPVVSGIVQHPPKPRDPAQVIREGAAAAALANPTSAAAITTVSDSGAHQHNSVQAEMQERFRKQAE